MTVGAGENGEVVFVAGFLALGVQGVTSDDEGGEVRCAAALAGDTAGKSVVEAIVACESLGGGFFDDGEGW